MPSRRHLPTPARVPTSLASAATIIGWALVALLMVLSPAALEGQAVDISRAEALVEEGNPEAAMKLLLELPKKGAANGRAYLLRSTAGFMLGDREGGKADLEMALRLDPGLRQAWLHRGALRLSERRYEEAHGDFEQARKLDPSAPDNDLNLGYTLLFLGRVSEAQARFGNYIEHSEQPAVGFFLIAKNYALAGYHALAIDHLERAIGLDEKQRLGAKTDPSFESLLAEPSFQRLLNTDGYRPPPGSLQERRSFEGRYDGGRGPLLGGVIDALTRLGIPFDPRIEVTPDWALVWSDVRVKIEPGRGEEGTVEFSAPPGSFKPGDWQARIEQLSAQISYELAPKIPG